MDIKKMCKEKMKKVGKWANAHKKEIGVGILLAIGAGVTAYNVKKVIQGDFIDASRVLDSIGNDPEQGTTPSEEMLSAVVPDDFDYSGNTLTARELGWKMGVSAQEINKRLIEKGLAYRYPCGDITLTEEGKKVGEYKDKMTKHGYGFTNIEWCENIISLLFSEEEIAAEEEHQAKLAKIREQYS